MKALPDQPVGKQMVKHCLMHRMETSSAAVASIIAQSRRADVPEAVA